MCRLRISKKLDIISSLVFDEMCSHREEREEHPMKHPSEEVRGTIHSYSKRH